MSAQQQIVAVGGVSLVALGLIHDKQERSTIMAALTGNFHNGTTPGGTSDTDTYKAAGKALGKIALQLLFVGGLTFAAGLSRAWGTAMAAVIIGLALLYAINSPGGPGQTAAAHNAAATHDPQQRTRAHR